MKIRKATSGDIEAIRSVGHRAWPATYHFAGAEYIAHGLESWWSVPAIERSLSNTTVLVAESEGDVVGTGNIDLRAPVPVIWKLYVVPAAQGRGVGSALVAELVRLAEGAPVRLEYTDGNDRAARFYAAQGFTEVRREPNDQPGWPAAVWVERPGDSPSGGTL